MGRKGAVLATSTRKSRRAPGGSWMLVCVLLASCSSDATEPAGELPLSGVLITLDTTNTGALDIYGKDRGLTPRLAQLAQSGVVFDRAHTVAPITLPAHTSMLTGLYPLRHGVRENGMMSLSGEAETLAERAREAGFETAAFVSASVLLAHYGLDQGFEVYDEPGKEDSGGAHRISERNSARVTDQALAWLANREGDKPFFLWVHYFDPHMPYTPPEEFLEKAGGNHYRAEVAAMDHDVGRLIDGLTREVGLEKLTLAVVADHGEAFHSHGEPTHSVFCYQSTIRVPFLIRFSDGRRGGTRSREVVSVVDLFPTFLEELGLGRAGDVDGLSLASTEIPADRGVYMESYSGYLTYGWSPLSGWVDAKGKYLHSSAPEFYDLEQDPGELQNLLSSGTVDSAPYRRALEELSRRPRLKPGGDVELSAAQIAELNALGYAAAGSESKELPDPLEPNDLPAPASQAELYAKSNFALGLLAAGEHHDAIRLLEQVVDQNPRDINALEGLGSALVKTNRFAEAIVPLEAVLASGNDRHLTRVCLGISYEKTGDFEKSLLHFRRALDLRTGGSGTGDAIERVEALRDQE